MNGMRLIIPDNVVFSTLFPQKIAAGAVLCAASISRHAQLCFECRTKNSSWVDTFEETEILQRLNLKPDTIILKAEANFGSLYLDLTHPDMPIVHKWGDAMIVPYEAPVPVGEP